MEKGIYQVQLAMLEFDEIPPNPDAPPTATTAGKPEGPTPSMHKPPPPHEPVSSILAIVEKGSAGRAWNVIDIRCWCGLLAIMHISYAAGSV